MTIIEFPYSIYTGDTSAFIVPVVPPGDVVPEAPSIRHSNVVGIGTTPGAVTRRCTCGFTRFRIELAKTSTTVTRWMQLTRIGGFGGSPLGTWSGGEYSVDSWVSFEPDNLVTVEVTSCENCRRLRATRPISGFTVMGFYVTDDYVYVVGADALDPITAYSVRLTLGDDTYEIHLSYYSGAPSDIETPYTPTGYAESLPPGAVVADTVLSAPLPEVDSTGDFSLDFVDSAYGAVIPLGTVSLEAIPMIVTPQDAEVSVPLSWLRNSRAGAAAQPASSTRHTVPFDKCDAVVEYDAGFATLPAAQGWTHQGVGTTADFSLVEGDALLVSTTAPNDSYWIQDVVLASAPTQAYLHAGFLRGTGITGTNPGDGFDLQALYGNATAPYVGARLCARDSAVRMTRLDSSAEYGLVNDATQGWLVVGAGDNASSETIWGPYAEINTTTTRYGTGGVAPSTGVRAIFGDTAGTGINLYLRNFVVSAPGRFVRARFVAYARVAAPVLRLYVGRDAAIGDTRARFLVRYGNVSNPHRIPSNTVSATVNLTAANSTYEVPITLSGLTANAPFVFTVEREWDHVDDTSAATAHLLYATLRSA